MYRLNAFLSESALSKGELEKPAGKGPNSGTPRIEIFAKKIADGEDHMLNDGTTIKILEITMNGEVYGVSVDTNIPSVPTYTYVPDDNFEQELINLGYDISLDDSVLTSNIDTIFLRRNNN